MSRPGEPLDHPGEVVGDFNGDGLDDVALPSYSAAFLPVVYANGTFEILPLTLNDDFCSWAREPGVRAYVGDFNGDQRADIGRCRGL